MVQENEELCFLLKNLPDAFSYNQAVTDSENNFVDFIILDVNSAFEEMIGITKNQLIGKRATQMPSKAIKDIFALSDTFKRAALNSETLRFEHFFDSLKRRIEVTAYGNERGCFSTIFRDLPAGENIKSNPGESPRNYMNTHFSPAENLDTLELKEERDKQEDMIKFQQEMLDTAAIWINTLDEEGNITFWNKAAEEISGYKAEEVLGHAEVWEWLYPDQHYRAKVLDKVQDIIQKREKVENLETQIQRKDGEYRTISWHSNNLLKNGKIVGSIALGADISEQKQMEEELYRIEWMLDSGRVKSIEDIKNKSGQPYGKLTQLNTKRLILDSIGEDLLFDIAKDYLNLLETSSAIYEKNGDYAFGIFSSNWCQFLDNASRNLCHTDDNLTAMESGKWLCHESCWRDAAQIAIETGQTQDTPCHGSLRLFTVPIWANKEVVGAINFGYGDPPQEPEKLKQIAEKYSVDVNELAEQARAYESRPPFIIELAKNRLYSSARLIGTMIEQRQTEEELRKSRQQFKSFVENASDIVFTGNDKGILTYVSPNWETLLGHCPEEVVGKSAFNFIHPEDRENVSLKLQEFLEKSTIPQEVEYRARHKNGTWIWHSSTLNILERNNEEVTILGIARDISERKRAENIMQSRLNIMKFASEHFIDEFLQKVINELCEVSGNPTGFFHFVAEDEKTIILKAWSSRRPRDCNWKNQAGKKYSLEEAGIWADCLRERRTVIRNDCASLTPEYYPEVTRKLVVPIVHHDKIVAILGVENKPQDYTEKDVQLVSFFADVAWEVLEHKRAEEKIRYMSFHDSLTDLYNRHFLEEEMQRQDTQRQLPISIIMADLNGLKLVNDTYGHSAGDELLKTAARIIKQSCRFEDIIARWGGDEFVILLPQTGKEEARNIYKRIKSKCETTFVKDIPISLSLGMETKTRVEENLENILRAAEDDMYKQKIAEGKSTKNNVVNALLKSLETKSLETEEHTRRMGKVALHLGKKLKLPDEELQRLKLLVILHDIGKINIPEEILTKKTPLSPKEWEIIKKHPETGYRIARATEEFAHIAEDILAHHERWDGSGYPRGLKGKEIPLLARITAIADAFEVMINGRPYKKTLSFEEATAELKRCSGTQFDPELIDIFLSVLQEESLEK